MAKTAIASDPFATFAFVVSIDGIATGFFQEVSGLTAQIDVQEVQEGGRNNTTRKLVGQGKFPNLVLKRGFANETLLDTLMKFHNSKDRLNGTITLRSAKGDDLASWDFKNGIPVKWDGPQLNVSQNAIAIESLEIAHEGLVHYTTATVDRVGNVESVSSGPPGESNPNGGTSSPYEENNVNAPVALPPAPPSANAAPAGAAGGPGGDNVNGAFSDGSTDSVNTTYTQVNNANPGSSDWEWQENAPPEMLEYGGDRADANAAYVNQTFEMPENANQPNELGWDLSGTGGPDQLFYGNGADLFANAATLGTDTDIQRPEIPEFGGGGDEE